MPRPPCTTQAADSKVPVDDCGEYRGGLNSQQWHSQAKALLTLHGERWQEGPHAVC